MFLFTYNYKSEQEHSFYTYKLSKLDKTKLKDGDIILRYGYGLVSDLIVETLKPKYNISHCGIVRRIDSTNFKIIHSVSSTISNFDGVQEQSLESFINDSRHNSVIVVRYKCKNDSLLSKISNRAQFYLDKKVPFDNLFEINDSSKIYCSELLWIIIKDEFNDDIFKNSYNKKKDYFKFDLFLDTSKFEIILNHQLLKKAN